MGGLWDLHRPPQNAWEALWNLPRRARSERGLTAGASRPVRGGRQADLVYGLLSAKNKPFSAQTAADHLQTEGIKKAVAQRALDSLVEKGKVTLKECGKTKVRGPAPPPGPRGA